VKREILNRIGATAVAVIAAIQWWELVDRADHIRRMYQKFEDFHVTAGVYGLAFFLICSLGGVTLGAAVTRACRRHTWPFHIARVATVAIGVGTIAWPVVIMSPLVRLVSR
jgi:hypothetical protein